MIKNAFWISHNFDKASRICPEFSRSFKASGHIKNAEISLTAIGVYEAFLNGCRIGSFVLAPGCTVYEKRLQYQTYDITSMLKEDNLLTITVGTGWHRGRISAGSPDINSMPCAIIAELTITYDDGTSETIISDDTFKVRESRILFSDIYDGEIYDASRPEAEYGQVVILKELAKDRLIPLQGEIICEHERIKPARIFTTPKGETVIDFGQNLAGYPEISLSNAKKGDKISLSFAEIIDAEGNFYTENYRSAKSEYIYVCTNGFNIFKPHFTFYGFRYIRINEAPACLSSKNITAIALYSDIKRTGSIECGLPPVNRLFNNILWSQKSNFIDIPTDCPQRDERMGWLGDAQVFAMTAGYNYNVKKFFDKWLADVRAAQFKNGAVPDIVPNFWRMNRSSTAWGDAITIIPWQMYMLYGDSSVLEDNFDAMERWVTFMKNDSLDEYLWTCTKEEKHLWGKHYGDWLAMDAEPGSYKGSSDDDFIASAFFCNSVDILVKAGKILGKNMSEYEKLHANIVKKFRERFPVCQTQTEHVLALYFNLTANQKATADSLARMILSNGCRLKTGFVGTPYLLHALSDNGYTELAYSLLLQEDYPSWLYEVNHGATTIWEHWDGIRDDGTLWSRDMNSYNHYAYGSVAGWIYTVAAGIRVCENNPGFEKVIISPMPDKRLNFLNATLNTAHGTIASKWSFEKDAVRYEISSPVPTLIIIDGTKYQLDAGSYIFHGRQH